MSEFTINGQDANETDFRELESYLPREGFSNSGEISRSQVYKHFDADRNGILEESEVIASLMDKFRNHDTAGNKYQGLKAILIRHGMDLRSSRSELRSEFGPAVSRATNMEVLTSVAILWRDNPRGCAQFPGELAMTDNPICPAGMSFETGYYGERYLMNTSQLDVPAWFPRSVTTRGQLEDLSAVLIYAMEKRDSTFTPQEAAFFEKNVLYYSPRLKERFPHLVQMIAESKRMVAFQEFDQGWSKLPPESEGRAASLWQLAEWLDRHWWGLSTDGYEKEALKSVDRLVEEARGFKDSNTRWSLLSDLYGKFHIFVESEREDWSLQMSRHVIDAALSCSKPLLKVQGLLAGLIILDEDVDEKFKDQDIRGWMHQLLEEAAHTAVDIGTPDNHDRIRMMKLVEDMRGRMGTKEGT